LAIHARAAWHSLCSRRILNMLRAGTPENCITVRYLYIVSREHQWLYRHLLERFHDDPDVQVILDRRVAERRIDAPMLTLEGERRRTHRRRAVGSEEDLRIHSHYLIELTLNGD
jgi:hypothetical protein